MSKKHLTDDDWKAIREKHAKFTPEEARAFWRRVVGPARRELVDEEYDKVWTLLQLTEPHRQSNNQRTWTDEFRIGDKRYDVTYGLSDKPEIKEVDETDS